MLGDRLCSRLVSVLMTLLFSSPFRSNRLTYNSIFVFDDLFSAAPDGTSLTAYLDLQ